MRRRVLSRERLPVQYCSKVLQLEVVVLQEDFLSVCTSSPEIVLSRFFHSQRPRTTCCCEKKTQTKDDAPPCCRIKPLLKRRQKHRKTAKDLRRKEARNQQDSTTACARAAVTIPGSDKRQKKEGTTLCRRSNVVRISASIAARTIHRTRELSEEVRRAVVQGKRW